MSSELETLRELLRDAEERIHELQSEVDHLRTYVDILTETEEGLEIVKDLQLELGVTKSEMAECRAQIAGTVPGG